MIMQSEQLLQTLLAETEKIIAQAEDLKNYDLATLTWKENKSSWNILECLEHLNLYGAFYLPEIAKQLQQSNTKNEMEFKSGILGSYFAKSMLPKEKSSKMKTFKDKNPLGASLDTTVITKFINQQHQLAVLLNQSRNVSLNKVRIPTSISSLLRLKLGDTYLFYVNHIIRHLAQINRIQENMKNA